MVTIILTLVYAAVCFKWGAWRRWREFYPTILYAIIGDFAYNFVFHDHTLWLYDGIMNHTLNDIIAALFLFPSIVILFLTHWPKTLGKQALYVLGWAAANTLFEYVSVLLDTFEYDHGWSIFWSFGLLVGAFVLLRLHYKKPLLVWPISAVLGATTVFIFGLPFETLK